MWRVEGDRARCAGAVNEQNHAARRRLAAQCRPGPHHLAHKDRRLLADDGRHRRANPDVVIDPKQAVAIISHGGGRDGLGKD